MGTGREIEETPAISLWAGRVGPLVPVHLRATRLADDAWHFAGWPGPTSRSAQRPPAGGRPVHLPGRRLPDLARGAATRASRSSGATPRPAGDRVGNRLVVGDRVVTEGAVGVLLGGGVDVEPVVSQGCRPYGQPVHRHPLRPQRHLRGGRLAGHGVPGGPDHRTSSTRADIAGIESNGLSGRPAHRRAGGRARARRLPGAHRGRGGPTDRGRGRRRPDPPRKHRPLPPPRRRHRPPRAAAACWRAGGPTAALMFMCNGRGTRLFDEAHHDAGLVQRSLGPVPVAGFFAAGEIGPVGGHQLRPRLHRLDGPVPGPLGRAPRRRRRRPWHVSTRPVGYRRWLTSDDCRPTRRRRTSPATPPSTSSGINVIRGLAMDAPRAANSGHTGHGHGPGPAGPCALHPGDAPRPVRTAAGPTATGSSSPTGTPRILLYSMLYLTGYGLDPRRSPRASASGAAAPPATPSSTAPPGSRSPPARSARAWPTAWAWASPSAGSGPTSPPRSATTTPSSSPATDASKRASPTRRPRWPATSSSAGWSTSTTTTTSPSTAPPSSPTTTTWASGSPPTGGRWRTSARWPTTSTPSRRLCCGPRLRRTRPSLIILRSHIGYPSPHLTDTAKAHGDPFPPDEIRLTKELLGPPRRRDLLGTRRRPRPVPATASPGARRSAGPGSRRFDAWEGDKARWDAAQRGHGLPGWESALPTFAPDDGPMATRKAVKACLDATGDGIPGLMPGSADLTGNTGMAMAGAVAQSVDEPGGEPHPLRHPRARHGRGDDRDGRPRRHPPGGRHLLRLQRLHAGGGTGGRPVRRPRHLLVDPRLDRARAGRPHPPARRAAGRRAGHARSPGHPSGRRQRDGAGLAGRRRRRRVPPPSILSRQELPVLADTAERAAAGRRPGRLRAVAIRTAARPGSSSSVPAARSSVCVAAADLLAGRRHRRPGGVLPVVGAVRPAARRLPATRCFPPACPRWPSRRPAPSAGSATPTPPWPSTTSGPRPRAR